MHFCEFCCFWWFAGTQVKIPTRFTAKVWGKFANMFRLCIVGQMMREGLPSRDYPNVCLDALGDATMITSLIFYWCNLGFGQAINYFYISQMYEPNAWCHNSGGPFFRQTRVSMKLSFCRCNSFSLISERWIHSLVLIVSKAIAKKWIHHLMVFLNHGDF